MRVAVLFGGDTKEREVSIASASQIIPALRSRGHEVIAIDTAVGALDLAGEQHVLTGSVGVRPPSSHELASLRESASPLALPEMIGDCDVVFLALHGGSGEDGRLQALLELAGLAYTGSGPLGSGLAMDKDIAKTILRAGGVRTPDWVLAPATADEVEATIGFPVVVKPTSEGSTVGLAVVRSPQELSAAIEKASQYGAVMVERFIPGRELTVGVLDGHPLAVGEIFLEENAAFSYAAKYQVGAVHEQFPAELPDSLTEEARALAGKAHRLLRLGGYSRSDFRLDDDGAIWIMETNSLPGMTATSLLPQSASAVGVGYAELCERICRLARPTLTEP